MVSNPSSPMDSEAAAPADDAMERAVQNVHAIIDRVAETAGPAIDRLLSGVNNATETLQSSADDFGEMQERWIESLRGTVRDHPLASIAVAVAAGVLLSRLTAR